MRWRLALCGLLASGGFAPASPETASAPRSPSSRAANLAGVSVGLGRFVRPALLHCHLTLDGVSRCNWAGGPASHCGEIDGYGLGHDLSGSGNNGSQVLVGGARDSSCVDAGGALTACRS